MQVYLNDHCLGVPENAKTNSNAKCQKNDTSILYTFSSPNRSKTISIKNFIDNVDEEEQESLEFILAQALFATRGTHLEYLQLLKKSKIAIEQTLMDSRIHISCNFINEIQTCIEEQWNYVYHTIMMVAYMLDPQFLEESRIYNIEPIGYNTFIAFMNQKFGQETATLNPVNNKVDTRTNETNYENHENEEVENIIYEEGICRGIKETKQIYSTDVDNTSMIEMELLNYY
ncbi:12249_t:CDS:2 [Gigaspora margarita]|uniref:12249_t:CDS:1 n=1 Tax=Gigaspora margarita TaxID=4874 RepID=A0ABN7UQL6_GIGMA|nr:12249_t:CDS:2 [Gigaspora margarita]